MAPHTRSRIQTSIVTRSTAKGVVKSYNGKKQKSGYGRKPKSKLAMPPKDTPKLKAVHVESGQHIPSLVIAANQQLDQNQPIDISGANSLGLIIEVVSMDVADLLSPVLAISEQLGHDQPADEPHDIYHGPSEEAVPIDLSNPSEETAFVDMANGTAMPAPEDLDQASHLQFSPGLGDRVDELPIVIILDRNLIVAGPATDTTDSNRALGGLDVEPNTSGSPFLPDLGNGTSELLATTGAGSGLAVSRCTTSILEQTPTSAGPATSTSNSNRGLESDILDAFEDNITLIFNRNINKDSESSSLALAIVTSDFNNGGEGEIENDIATTVCPNKKPDLQRAGRASAGSSLSTVLEIPDSDDEGDTSSVGSLFKKSIMAPSKIVKRASLREVRKALVASDLYNNGEDEEAKSKTIIKPTRRSSRERAFKDYK